MAYDKSKRHAEYLKNRLKYKESDYRRRYGLSLDEYSRLSAAQRGLCAICGSTPHEHNSRQLVVDHDHVTGKIRGLLCHKCNSGLGMFKDSPHLLKLALVYLQPTL